MTDMGDYATEEQILKAGSMIDRVVKHMIEQKLPPIAVASALLGGALNVLSASLPDDAILRILHNAIDSVESGELRDIDQPRQ
ncbi:MULTISPECIES: hypothetical protein [Acidiphilium]|uniref:Uncharacterized protein n=1 Tax=Acidiphilium iwatense TaxID=768198 RepID=A0ABS9DST4_9PROT|nr:MULTISPECIES: hypothetical protein [Acidiphilium]MCF3945245.1 hypothetical protein [Acidiphilium iwatense]